MKFDTQVNRLCILALAAVLLAAPAGAAPTFLSPPYANGNAGSSVSASLATEPSGTTNVVFVGVKSASVAINAPTDTLGTQYQLAAGPTLNPGGPLTMATYVGVVPRTGSNMVTVTFSGPAPNDLRVLEYSGAGQWVGSGAGYDAGAQAVAAVTAAVGDTVVAGDLITSTACCSSAGSGWTQRIVDGQHDLAEDKAPASSGTYNATAAIPNTQWIMEAVVLRAGPPDAGQDAGVVDAGAGDAGVDGGADAGTPDAGADAGQDDAGSVDGGVVDAGTDAGQPDSGTPDGGQYTPVRDLGTAGAGKIPMDHWMSSESAAVQDPVGGDLLVLGWASDGTTWFRASPDQGRTWAAWQQGAGLGGVLMDVHSDALGKIHALWMGSSLIEYSRLSPTRDGAGHVVGLVADVTGVALPPSVNTLGATVQAQLLVSQDYAGAPCMLWFVLDDQGGLGRLQAGRTAGLTPNQRADFTDLHGAPASGSLVLMGTTADSNPHNSGFSVAQVGSTAKVYVTFGPHETGDTSKQNHTPLTRTPLDPDAQGWAVGSPVTVATFNVITPQVGGAASSQDYAWVSWFDPARGLVVDRIDYLGAATTLTLPASYPPGKPGAIGTSAISVAPDQVRLAVGVIVMYDSSVAPQGWFGALAWDGAAWTTYPDHLPTAANWQDGFSQDCWGMGGGAWPGGLVLVPINPNGSPERGEPGAAALRL
jgi:hypothetical protein